MKALKLQSLLPALLVVFLIVACEDQSSTSGQSDQSGTRPQSAAEVKSIFNRGRAHYKAKEFKAAFDEWLLAAESGHAHGQYLVGFLLDRGKGIPKDDAKANEWYLKAAEQGHADAQYELGLQLNYGYGTPNPSDQAAEWKDSAKWFRAAAEQGNAKAQGWLGDMYQSGKGVPSSLTEAIKWYQKGAAQGDNNSLRSLARFQESGEHNLESLGLTGDDETAVQNYLKAARNGDYWAASALEDMFDAGRTSLAAADIVEIYEELAKRTSDGTGQISLAEIYLEGRLTERDTSKAAFWFEKASERGFTRNAASFQLAKLYLVGDGVPRDTAKAARLFAVAGEHSNAEARLQLALLYANGDGVEKDLPKAHYWASLAAKASGRRDEDAQEQASHVLQELESEMTSDQLDGADLLMQARRDEQAGKKKAYEDKELKELENSFAD